MFAGFLIGASIPFVFGVYALLGSHVVTETDSSGGYSSGVIPLRALLLIFIASPMAGVVGAIATWILGRKYI